MLQDSSEKTLAFYQPHAYAFITDTRVSWNFNKKDSYHTTRYELKTTLKEGSRNKTHIAWILSIKVLLKSSQKSKGG